jgi:hypothetical protein
MGDEALDAAERLGEGEVTQPGDASAHVLRALEFEGDHGAEGALLAHRHDVAGMVGQAGIVNAPYRVRHPQRLDDGSGVFLVHADACVQSAQAAHGEITVER